MRQMEVVLLPGEFDMMAAIRDGLFSANIIMDKYPPAYYKGRIALKYRYVFAEGFNDFCWFGYVDVFMARLAT